MSSGNREKTISVLGVVLISLSMIWTVSVILVYTGGDVSGARLNTFFASRVYPLFNHLSWAVAVLGLYWGWRLLTGKGVKEGVFFTLLVGAVCATLSIFSYNLGGADPAGVNLGGRLGAAFAQRVHGVVGTPGTEIATITGLVIFFALTTGFSLREGALKLENFITDIPTKTKEIPVKRILALRPKLLRLPARKPVGRAAQVSAARPETPAGRSPAPATAEPEVAETDEEPSLFKKKLRLIKQGEEPPQKAAREPVVGKAHSEPMTTSKETGADAEYEYPPLSLFEDPEGGAAMTEEELRELASTLESKLGIFGVEARVVEIHPGPVITRFELEPGSGVKVHQVVNLADDLALALKATSIRILAPIPGKGTIGIEVPNKNPCIVSMKEILASQKFASTTSRLEIALGRDVSGKPYTADLEKMPHLLIAGATGSGKSVCINSIITSLVYRNSPKEVQLLLIDPKRLELSIYKGIPHLLCEVVTEPKKAVRALHWVIEEMDMRYKLLAGRGVRNIQALDGELPFIVVIIDELADLMLSVPQDLEMAIAKLAQMARAVGIHLVVATQRPSVDVITGVIKANLPCRIAFKVASRIDSRTILDANGAEVLLGKGDMLFMPPATAEPLRIHGAFVSSDETRGLVDFLNAQSHLAQPGFSLETPETKDIPLARQDELFQEAAQIVVTTQQGSVSILQRRLRVGYSRAARLIDLLEEAGIVGPFEGSKARQVLINDIDAIPKG
jgi:S-DNA-T family DNA segregation ATPase FtsK/SpoIIIE